MWEGTISELGITDEVIKQNMKKEKGFRDVFPIDTLPKKIKKFEKEIISLDISTGPGTHWVCYYNDPQYDFVEYFDPFGEYINKGFRQEKAVTFSFSKPKCPKSIETYLKTSGKKPIYNTGFLQKIDFVKCGYFYMKYITERNKGDPPARVIYSLTQYPSDYNENLVLNK
ncbi:hypothetical protein AVEN_83623-1 [Araneus ventricosus]|uniref:Ubiquitin-like protease family profile domain-containing protein n=1 Tax=Araneus ventricosus TaxID=182803 RepID=A0A4Y2T8R9_ARAVE|nr:hypothetical protein AVEN_83623-1 [Araneus ventricosus]